MISVLEYFILFLANPIGLLATIALVGFFEYRIAKSIIKDKNTVSIHFLNNPNKRQTLMHHYQDNINIMFEARDIGIRTALEQIASSLAEIRVSLSNFLYREYLLLRKMAISYRKTFSLTTAPEDKKREKYTIQM